MSIQLKLTHEDGVRLRQQSAHKVERTEALVDGKPTSGGVVRSGTDWKFDRFQEDNGKSSDEVPQDRDPRRVGNDGKKIPLGTYTVHVTAGMRNLVIERKGKVTSFNFKNPAVRNQMRIKYQELKASDRKTKDGKVVHEWKDSGQAQYIPPNTPCGVFVGDNQRAIVDECPT
jgi:hypothetical protein